MRSVCDPVHAEQVRSSYAHLPLTLSVSVLNSALLGFVLATTTSEFKILIWIGLVVGLSTLRLALWDAHRRLDVAQHHNPWWTRLAFAGTLASGILWGSGIFVFSPLDVTHLLFFTLVISGMCAGAATVHAAYFPLVIGFILPAIAPLAVNFFMQGNRLQVVSGIMMCIFGTSLCAASLTFRRWFSKTTSARLALARQAKEISDTNARLNDTNARLNAEITNHRSTAEKLQNAQKMEAIGLLTAGVAHDFNNILAAIRGSAELIEGHAGSDSAHARQISIIMQAVERAATLTRQLLAVGRKQTLVPRTTDINKVLLGMKELLITTLSGHGNIELQLAAVPVVALIDTAQLQRAILNLVINARDAMPNGGMVTLKTGNLDVHSPGTVTEGLVGSLVVISVSDTGAGMSERVRLQAFDPFFTTKDVGSGSGMGLSQVYGLVKQSGGETRIDSHVGRGTTVSIFLPRVPMDSVSAQSDAQAIV
jgi:signal transduction histidine kinase